MAAMTIAPIPSAIAQPRDVIRPDTLLVNVLDMASSPSCCSYFGTFEGLHETFDVCPADHSTRTAMQTEGSWPKVHIVSLGVPAPENSTMLTKCPHMSNLARFPVTARGWRLAPGQEIEPEPV